jgi:uncharacterized protein YigA (DUF484 family)
MKSNQCQAALVHAQQRYLQAKDCFEALDAVRDQLLEPLDSGEPLALTAAEQRHLAWLDREERKVYPSVLAAEAPLLAAARAWLAQHPDYVAQHPEYATIITIPRGAREKALELAAHLEM